MKLLMLYASAGGGHKKAAEVVKSYLQEQDPSHQILLVDTLKEVNWLADKFCCDGYQLVAKYAPGIFGAFYKTADKESSLADLVPTLTARMSRKLLPLIRQFQPDVILTTYHFSAQMVSHLKGTGQIRTPLVSIITDYGPHRAWISPHVDAYVVSDSGMIEKLMARGVPQAIIHPFGIPVESKFFRKQDTRNLRLHIGLDPQLPTLLFMAGSFGVRSVRRIYQEISELSDPLQCIVITGRNKTLYRQFQQLAARSPHDTKLVYFTAHVDRYMHASDLLLTKPGGLTLSESLASNLPLAVFGAIPGQEEDNEQFLLQHNMAVSIQENTCAATVSSLLRNPGRLAAMKNACKAFDKSDCASNICSLLKKLAESSGNSR